MPSRTILGTPVQSGETFNYTATIRDEAGVAINLQTATTAATLSYYRKATGVTINSRLNQDVRGGGTGANNHTLGTTGLLTWKSVVADSSFAGATDTPVVARYTISYNDGASVARVIVHEVEFTIEGMPVLSEQTRL
jgi:hypothetical protein